MFGISFSELLIILLVAFILIGPEKLPKVAQMMGKGMKEFRKFAANLGTSLKEGVDDVVDEELVNDIKKVKNLKQDVKATVQKEVEQILPEELQTAVTDIKSVKSAVSPQAVKDKVIDAAGLTEVKEIAADFKKPPAQKRYK